MLNRIFYLAYAKYKSFYFAYAKYYCFLFYDLVYAEYNIILGIRKVKTFYMPSTHKYFLY